MIKYIIAAVCAVCASGVARSADAVTSAPADSTNLKVQMSEVTVIGARMQAVKMSSEILPGVIDNSELTATSANSLAQGLSFTPGVRVETGCQNCGMTQVRMNGLDGHYSQILINSHPVFPSLLSIYGLELLPTSQIERIEVTRGGGIIGTSSAIGGTINLVSHEATDNSVSVAHTLEARKGFDSFENVTDLNASIVSKDKKAGSYIFAQARHRNSWDADGDGYSEMTRLNNHVIGADSHLNYRNMNYGLQLLSIASDSRGGNNLDLPPFEANIAEMVRHNVNGGMFTADYCGNRHKAGGYASVESVSRDSYYGGMGSGSADDKAAALLAYGKTRSTTVLAGVRDVMMFPSLLGGDADLTIGGEYRHDRLNDRALGYDVTNQQHIDVESIYAQGKYGRSDWEATVGLRLDKHNLISKAMIRPMILVRYDVSKNVHLRANYSGGYRAPELYDEDLHVSMVGGSRVRTVLAAGLKEETAHSVNLSCDGYFALGIVRLNMSGEVFYTKLCNSFDQRYLPNTDANGFTLLERYNTSGMHICGINLELQGSVDDLMHFDAGFTIQNGRYSDARHWSDDAEPTNHLFRSPSTYGYCSMCWHIGHHVEACITGVYTGKMWMQHCAGSGVEHDEAVRTPQFFDVTTKCEYHFPIFGKMTGIASIGVKNLFNSYQKDFDKGAERDSKYIYGPSMPFSPFAGMKIEI